MYLKEICLNKVQEIISNSIDSDYRDYIDYRVGTLFCNYNPFTVQFIIWCNVYTRNLLIITCGLTGISILNSIFLLFVIFVFLF